MNFEDLNEENFILYAMKNYENNQCLSEKDFNNDLKIFKYLRRLLNRYENGGNIKVRLILNHLIMLTNVFPVYATTRMLFFKMPEKYWSVLKTFLIFLKYMPETVESVNGKKIISSNILIDMKVAEQLRKV
tara:strand:- start:390 stop:782 length:393 start_codon:yes stop_codon:yes gene_type:complete